MAGIRPLEPGYRKFLIDLTCASLLDHIDASILTVRGKIHLKWRKDGQRIDLDLTVPVGASATFCDGVYRASTLDGVAMSWDSSALSLGAGSHALSLTRASADTRPMPPLPSPQSRSTLWLSGNRDTGLWQCEDALSRLKILSKLWTCNPVFHEPVHANIIQINHGEWEADQRRWIRLSFDAPMDLSPAVFVFAHLDLCGSVLTGRKIQPVLQVKSLDGDCRSATVRMLPACWNRVAVDVGDWPGRDKVLSLSIGIHWSKDHDIAQGPNVAPPEGGVDFRMMVSRVGYSTAKRTW